MAYRSIWSDLVQNGVRATTNALGRALGRSVGRGSTQPVRRRPRGHRPYPGDFFGQVSPVYAPNLDSVPDPGEVGWTWVPFEVLLERHPGPDDLSRIGHAVEVRRVDRADLAEEVPRVGSVAPRTASYRLGRPAADGSSERATQGIRRGPNPVLHQVGPDGSIRHVRTLPRPSTCPHRTGRRSWDHGSQPSRTVVSPEEVLRVPDPHRRQPRAHRTGGDPAGAAAELLHHRAHRPREVDAGRPDAAVHRCRRRA